MLKQLGIMVLVVTLFTGCKSKSALNYNEAIIDIERSLNKEAEAVEIRATSFVETGKYDSLAIAGENMEKKVQDKINEIEALPVPNAKGAGDFKAAVLAYFRHIKNLYTDYKNLGKAETQELRDKVITNLQALVAQTPVHLDKLRAAQKKYASDNGFKLQ